MKTSKGRPTRQQILFWVLLFLLLSVLNFFVVGGLASHGKVAAVVELGLLLALYIVLIIRPSDAEELDRILDLEAATATLGLTMWTALMWPIIYGLLHKGNPSNDVPGSTPLFIFVTYFVTRGLMKLRYH